MEKVNRLKVQAVVGVSLSKCALIGSRMHSCYFPVYLQIVNVTSATYL